MALTPLHVRDVCHGAASAPTPGHWFNTQNNICKYLTYEWNGNIGVQLCLKKAPAIVAEKKAKGELPNFDKLKDHCPGYRYLKYIDQGYNVKP